MIEQYLNNINLLPKGSRNVDQLTLDGQFINKHNSSAEAAESFGYRNGRFWIKDCILGKRQEAFGFKWRYSNDK